MRLLVDMPAYASCTERSMGKLKSESRCIRREPKENRMMQTLSSVKLGYKSSQPRLPRTAREPDTYSRRSPASFNMCKSAFR